MPPQHSFTVRYAEDVCREAVRTFIWRRLVVENKGLWATAAALVALVVYLVATGDRSWHLGLIGAAAIAPVLMILGAWRAHFVNTVGRFRRMQTPEARFALDETGIVIAAEDGDATIKWPAVTELWRRPRVWMVFLAPSQFFLVPTEGVPPDALAFLTDQVKRRAV